LSLVHFFFSRPSPLPVPPPLPYSTLFRSPALSRWWVGPRAAASSLRPALPGCTGSSSQDHADPALITPPRYLLCSPEPSGTGWLDRKSTRLNSSHVSISYAVFCLEKKETM